MKLNHINLTVDDAEQTGRFLEEYFNCRYGGGSKKMAFVSDDNGMVITLFRRTTDTPARYPESFHIGFIQPSPDHVNQINARLKADGHDVPEPSKQHGSWTFYFQAPGGFTIEVLC